MVKKKLKLPFTIKNGTKEHLCGIIGGLGISALLIIWGYPDKGFILGSAIAGYSLGAGKGWLEARK